MEIWPYTKRRSIFFKCMSPRAIKVSIAGVNLDSLVSVLYFPVKNFKGLSMGENLKKDFL